MYINEELKAALAEQGNIYSPYLYRQHMPFMVLDRIYLSRHLNLPLSCQFTLDAVISYTIRAVRDIKFMPKKYQEQLQEIWTPGLEAFSSILDAFVGRHLKVKGDLVNIVHKKLVHLGFDPLTMGYYEEGEHPALRNFTSEIKFALMNTCLTKYKKRRKAIFRQSNVIKIIRKLRTVNLAACLKSMRESVDLSGRYFTLLYFVTFANHYDIPDKLKSDIEDALSNGNFYSDAMDTLAEYMRSYTNIGFTQPGVAEYTQLFK